MARIPEHIVDQIYNAVDVVEVVQDYLPLKKRGANYWALSPFVNEKTPSFAVNPVKGIYKDFSSGKGGNAVNFLMEVEGFTYVEALRHLAKKYSIDIPEEEGQDQAEYQAQRNRRDSLFIVNEFAARWFHEQLTQTEPGKAIGLSYFKERGLLDQTIQDFQLGYSPDAWQAFCDAAAANQYQEEYLLELGLVGKSEKNGRLYDRFRERVMFPITNAMGKVVGFGGRILGQKKDVGKYINSSESEIYHKSQVLYGLYQAKQAIRNEDLCILTEGYLDVILLHQNGIKNVVASSGTALTLEQIRLIRRFTKNVLMIYDGDAAGIKAAMRGIDLLIAEGLNAKVLILPDKHDPDSYVREFGANTFLETCSTEALGFLAFKMRVLGEQHDGQDARQQAEIIKELAATIARVPDRVERQLYVKEVAQHFDITEGLMTHAVGEATRTQLDQDKRERQREQARIERAVEEAEVKDLETFKELPLSRQEQELLRVMVNHFDKSFVLEEEPEEMPGGEPVVQETIPLMDYLAGELEVLSFENQSFEQLKQTMIAEYDERGNLQLHRYLNHEDAAICNLVSSLLTIPEISPRWQKIRADISFDGDLRRVVMGAVLHYKHRKIDQLLLENRERLKAAQEADNEAELDELFELYQHLLAKRREIHRALGTEGAISGSDGRL